MRDLKQAVLRNESDHQPIRAAWREHGVEQERILPLAELKSALRIVPGQKIVYVTDVAWHQDNVTRIVELARNADLLFIEAAFLERDAEHGRRKFHLTARQAGEIARAAHAGCVIPMHFSPRYQRQERALLHAEVEAALSGASSATFL